MTDELNLPSYIHVGPTFNQRPIAQVDDNVRAEAERKFEAEAAEVTMGDVARASADQDWVSASLERWSQMNNTADDPNYVLDEESYNTLTEGLAPEYHDVFQYARSAEHAEVVRQQMLDKQERDRIFAMGGWSGFATRLGVNIADPVNVLLTAVTAPVSVLSNGGRLMNAARTGAFVAAENMALESTLYLGDYSKEGVDMLYAGFGGLVLGGLAGSLHKGDGIVETMMEDLAAAARRGAEHIDERHTMDSAVEAVDVAAGEAPVNPLISVKEEARAIREERKTLSESVTDLESQVARTHDEIATIMKGLEEVPTARSTPDDDLAQAVADITARRQALEWLKEYDKRILLNDKNPSKYPARDIPDPDLLEGDIARLVGDYIGRKADLKRDLAELEEYAKGVEARRAEAPVEDFAKLEAERQQTYAKSQEQIAKLNAKVEKLNQKLESYHSRLSANAKKREAWEKKREAALKARMAEIGVSNPAGDSAGAARQMAQKPDIELSEDPTQDFTPNQLDYGRSKYDKIRYSISAQFSKLKIPQLRWFGHHAVLDSVGRQGDELNVQSASEYATQMVQTNRVKLFRASTNAFKAWSKANKIGWFKRDFHRGEFAKELSRLVRTGDRSNIPELNTAADAVADIFEDIGQKAKEAGVVGFENFTPNRNYIPRILNLANFHKLNQSLRGGIYDLLEEAIRRANPELEPKQARAIAEGYVNRMARMEAGVDFNMNNLSSRHTLDSIEDSLRGWRDDNGKALDEDSISEIIDKLTLDRKQAKLDSKPSRAKSRTLMDEDTSLRIYDHELGTTRDVHITELFENNAEQLVSMYLRQMSGRIAMARLNPLWFGSDARFQTFLTKTRKYGSQELGLAQKELDEEVGLAQWVWDYMMGRPVEQNMDGKYAQFARNVRDWNYMRLMGQVGWAQIPEFANTVAFAGWKTLIRHVPELTRVMVRAKDGSLNDTLQEELELILGTGADWLINPVGVRYDDYGLGSTVMEKGTRAISAVSGMAPINTFLQRTTARVIAQRFVDMAQGAGSMSKAEKAQLGLSDDMFDRIMQMINKHSDTVPGTAFKTAKVRRLNVEKWLKDDPNAADAFTGALNRMARKIIQENDVGNTARFMHSTTGKLVMQFRTFASGAYEKQLLSTLALGRDDAPKIFQSFTLSMLLAGLSYVGQTYTNAAVRADREEYLEKRLEDGKVFKAAWARAGWASFLPGVVDSASFVTGNDPIFAHARTSMQPSGLLMGIPTVNLIDSAYNASRDIVGGALGNREPSQQSLNNLWQTMAFQNTMAGAAAIAALKEASDLPKYTR